MGFVAVEYVTSILGHFNYIKELKALTTIGIPPKAP